MVLHDSHSKPSEEKPVDVLRWQGRTMGLLDIGYHLIIDREGIVHRIRDVRAVGSHAPGFNHLSVGVCLIGGLTEDGKRHEDSFTTEQRSALYRTGAAFLAEWPGAEIKGHTELKGCQPGKNQVRCPFMDMDAVRVAIIGYGAAPTLSELTKGRRDRDAA
jgi:N-acetylmuramoyl-L-alanine amidase